MLDKVKKLISDHGGRISQVGYVFLPGDGTGQENFFSSLSSIVGVKIPPRVGLRVDDVPPPPECYQRFWGQEGPLGCASGISEMATTSKEVQAYWKSCRNGENGDSETTVILYFPSAVPTASGKVL